MKNKYYYVKGCYECPFCFDNKNQKGKAYCTLGNEFIFIDDHSEGKPPPQWCELVNNPITVELSK